MSPRDKTIMLFDLTNLDSTLAKQLCILIPQNRLSCWQLKMYLEDIQLETMMDPNKYDRQDRIKNLFILINLDSIHLRLLCKLHHKSILYN